MNDLRLKKWGCVKVQEEGSYTYEQLKQGGLATIEIAGFEAENASRRDVVVLALVWAIGALQRELTTTLAKNGGSGNCFIGD